MSREFSPQIHWFAHLEFPDIHLNNIEFNFNGKTSLLYSEEELAETYLDEAQDWTGKAENFFKAHAKDLRQRDQRIDGRRGLAVLPAGKRLARHAEPFAQSVLRESLAEPKLLNFLSDTDEIDHVCLLP